jgi:hypothetical protein
MRSTAFHSPKNSYGWNAREIPDKSHFETNSMEWKSYLYVPSLDSWSLGD